MTETLPRWDTASIFPALDSRELAVAHEGVIAGVARLVALYDRHDVRGGERTLDDAAVAAVEAVIEATNEVLEQARVVEVFAYAFTSTDAGNDTAQGLRSTLAQQTAPLRSLTARLGEWLHALGVDELIDRSQVVTEHTFPLDALIPTT